MVEGLKSFAERFKDYTDCFTVIGGAACDILMTDTAAVFRETRDIDMILIVEDKFPEFAKIFWEYVKEGGYTYGWKKSEKMHFYRFTEPKIGYPFQIELFSRNPEHKFNETTRIIPVPIDEDDISSLSAMLLDDNYYNLMLEGRTVVNGVPVLDSAYLMVFKMYAFLNLVADKKAGKLVKERDYKKHKNDVFRLMQIVDRNKRITLVPEVKQTVSSFCEFMNDQNISYRDLGIPTGDKDTDLIAIKEIFSI